MVMSFIHQMSNNQFLSTSYQTVVSKSTSYQAVVSEQFMKSFGTPWAMEKIAKLVIAINRDIKFAICIRIIVKINVFYRPLKTLKDVGSECVSNTRIQGFYKKKSISNFIIVAQNVSQN